MSTVHGRIRSIFVAPFRWMGQFIAADPQFLGPIKLIGFADGSWRAEGGQIDPVLERFGWTG